jgi:hypothetical protein
MSRRSVKFHPIKETTNNLALLNRPGQRSTRNFMRNPTPSANFGSQWGITKQGYNLNTPPNNIAVPIINPNRNEPQRSEVNLPFRIPMADGWYSTIGRAGIIAGYSENNLASLVPEQHKYGYYMRSTVLPFRESKATNGAPVPLPRTWRRQDKLRNVANANKLLRNINRTVRSRHRKNKTRRNHG